ncbi:MAG: hypothetical protein M3Z37_08715 [Candidatus Eremiobacteraeota bacterium]|nr:hypothetical protein [Candidatus Eremiobacteraeota bacterium]
MRAIAALGLALGLAACSAGATGAPNVNQNNPHDPNFSALQLAVGTANIYGNGNPALNIVSTLRQPNGTSATGVNTPTLSGPFTLTVAAQPGGGTFSDLYQTVLGAPTVPTPPGPSLSETTGAPVISGTSQTVHPGTPFCDTSAGVPGFKTCLPNIPPNVTSLGQSGGVFASGIAPYNHSGPNSYSYQPYAQPLYAGGVGTPTADGVMQFIPWGGPPAFDPDVNGMGTRDGIYPLPGTDSFGDPYFLGVAEGITTFEYVRPQIGAYALATQIGTVGSGGAFNITTVSASATLSSLALLPALATPVVTPDASGDGGATFTAALPAGVSEALVQIVDYGPNAGPQHGGANVANCHGPKGTSFAPVYYTVFITASGTYQLGALHGPNTNITGGVGNLTPSHSICTLNDNNNPPDGGTPPTPPAGDNITVQMIGFDYPAYEMVSGLLAPTVPQRPTLAGANGQADITISHPVEEDYPNYTTQLPLATAQHGFSALTGMPVLTPAMLSAEQARKLGVPIR